MTLTFEVDPVVDSALRDGVLSLWADVTNAGGSVGFVPPSPPTTSAPRCSSTSSR